MNIPAKQSLLNGSGVYRRELMIPEECVEFPYPFERVFVECGGVKKVPHSHFKHSFVVLWSLVTIGSNSGGWTSGL